MLSKKLLVFQARILTNSFTLKKISNTNMPLWSANICGRLITLINQILLKMRIFFWKISFLRKGIINEEFITNSVDLLLEETD